MKKKNKSVLALLKLRLPGMTKVLTRIGTFIQENPEQVTLLSINEVADGADASIASVMRLCNELDFNSFAGFKLALAMELAVVERAGTQGESDESISSNAEVLGAELCEVIRMTAGLVHDEDIDAIAKDLIRAKRILLHGIGASHMPAEFMSYKLTRLGIDNFITADSHMTRMAVTNSGSEDVLILFSSSGSIRESIELAKLAQQHSLPTIAFTNRFKSPLGEVCDRQVVGIGSETPLSSGSLQSKCGQLFFVELLFEAICRLSVVHAERIQGAADAVADKQY
jgi:RpiR family carbohydrate utilization transcriptional regulator